MTTRRALLGATLALPALSTARAQDAWPERAVRMVVPFPPGQAADIFARVMAEELSKRWPQRVVVENRAGGAGAIGMDAVARATPDGYTLGIGTSGTLGVNPSVMARLPYDAEKDFAAITNIFTLPLVFVAHPSFEASDMAGLVALARAQPGMVQYASAGPGTAQHMTAEMLAHRLGLRMQHVPYRGSGPAMADLIAGNVKVMVDSLASALPNVQGGRVKALGVTGSRRTPQMPDVPTVAETVSPGFQALGWSGIVAPAGTPQRIIRKVNADAVAILRDPAIAARMVQLGGFPDPGTPEEYGAFIRAEIAKWREVARAANVRLDG
ncbi:Bug family tripartite tricarboxylate transporter substrate binding protein [Falsiroseomonas selenitidurans]|uniref:Tripartite tricarboxylate transporter substrate binding protein n=1 Tax=Falsiroseomonas selenitidurans TaxID=2716335 RepID=A0ABX1E863_9PROT|nr:tripartite tricarboxylate transporter substrate binding protein [Falsiroseomonas selenitidurans]NKC32983.1 tripartite tricarboxylate transporter substrate binding protein [Falsiroseomonas selenitidurans]